MTEAIKAKRRPTQSFSKRPGKKSHSSFILFIAPSGVYTDPSHCFMNPSGESWWSLWGSAEAAADEKAAEVTQAQNSLGTDYIDYSS